MTLVPAFYYLTMANHALTMKPLPTMFGSGLSSLYHVYHNPTQLWLTLLFDQGHKTEIDSLKIIVSNHGVSTIYTEVMVSHTYAWGHYDLGH